MDIEAVYLAAVIAALGTMVFISLSVAFDKENSSTSYILGLTNLASVATVYALDFSFLATFAILASMSVLITHLHLSVRAEA